MTSDAAGTHTFNSANEITDSGYSFDANGNETAGPSSQSFTYNARNQTTGVTAGGTTLSALAYAGLDETERTATNQSSFASSPQGVTVSKTSGSSTYFVRDNAGGVLGERTPDGNHWYYLRDRLGSIVAVINGSGSTVANRYGYDPFGKPTYTSTTVANPLGFAGGWLDSTGLIKFGTRYYDPKSARWTQQDAVSGAISSPGSMNRYIYAGCDPINATDPTGYFCSWMYQLYQIDFAMALAALTLLGEYYRWWPWASWVIDGLWGAFFAFIASAAFWYWASYYSDNCWW